MTPNPDTPLTVTQFICAIRDRYIERAKLPTNEAMDVALDALESWEASEGAADLTHEVAIGIADHDLEHWDA